MVISLKGCKFAVVPRGAGNLRRDSRRGRHHAAGDACRVVASPETAAAEALASEGLRQCLGAALAVRQRGALGNANQASKPKAPSRGFDPGTNVSSFSSAPK